MQPYEQRFPWNLDWNLLRTFMIVVDQRGLTRAADFLGVTTETLLRWRKDAWGPKYSQPTPRMVRYLREDLITFLKEHQV